MRRTAVERQGRKPQPCCRKARVSDVVYRQQDKQKIQELIGGAIKCYRFEAYPFRMGELKLLCPEDLQQAHRSEELS